MIRQHRYARGKFPSHPSPNHPSTLLQRVALLQSRLGDDPLKFASGLSPKPDRNTKTVSGLSRKRGCSTERVIRLGHTKTKMMAWKTMSTGSFHRLSVVSIARSLHLLDCRESQLRSRHKAVCYPTTPVLQRACEPRSAVVRTWLQPAGIRP